MSKTGSLIFVFLAAIPAAALSANWQLASIGANDDKYYIDGDSVSHAGQYRKVWVMESYTAPVETDAYPKKTYRSAKLLQYYDCKQQSTVAVRLVAYAEPEGRGDNVESKSVVFKPTSLQEVVPDSVGESLLKAVCGTPAQRALRHKILSQD